MCFIAWKIKQCTAEAILCCSSEAADFSVCHIVHIINLSLFPPESRVKVHKALLSACEENDEPLALLSRFRKDVNRVFLCWEKTQLCWDWFSNNIWDQVVPWINTYQLSWSVDRNMTETFKAVLIQDCETLKILSEVAVVHTHYTVVPLSWYSSFL